MLLTKEVTMNLNYRGTPIVLDALQGDSCRALVIHFVAGETAWEIPADAEVFLQYCCADGTGGTFDALSDGTSAYSVNGDALTINLVPQLCAVAGHTQLQVTLCSGDTQLTTFPIVIRVSPQVNADTACGEYTNLQQWLDRHEFTGKPGKSNHIPEKGVDYWTETDKEEIVAEVLAELPIGDLATKAYVEEYINSLGVAEGAEF